MAKMKRYPLPWTTVYSSSTTPDFLPATAWMEASRVESVRATFEMRAKTGDIEVSFAFQTANVPDTPSPAGGTSVGNYQDSNAVLYPSGITAIGSSTAGKQLVRFGWLCKNTSSSDLNLARVGGTMEVEECGG